MTDLQMSLIGASGVFVAGVFAYNKWQEHKAKKSVERAFSSEHDDVLLRPGDIVRSEPTFDVKPAPVGDDTPAAAPVPVAAPVAAAPAARFDDEAAQPVAPVAPVAAPVEALSPATELATSLVDPLIDVLIPLALEAPVRGDKILPILHTLRHVGNKPVHFIGLHVNGDWEPIVHGGVYTKLQAGVQMASRTTALNELEYSELVTRLRAVADDIGAEPEIPDMIEVMGESRTLHRFVAGHDAQLGVNLMSYGAPWSIATLIGALEKQGFDVRPDGRYIMPDGDGGQLFTLTTNVTLGADTTSRLTLLLDVPCVAPARDGFGAMLNCAKALVGRLDAVIVDDSDQPLTDQALAEINSQVLDFYQEMEAADIAAGSTRAMRLFS
ncbi:cell division protein ZipA C-terminal FtsZ-binding domain-containing protein [Massilia pseudoviolaceinigra]|uniref:cell division protein ZipA C-terminal FtsZ-binding domain-containing protein n=1 Tax=Massilia pseudoviolaceinigra TaxID=3057165 RepID=UPI002796732E|nr:cell division protein ZipA C-terminal FtsZ-binding domain-containing protein [Massilia sp. CCM 9206]MDQ1920673.1 cell division protein ZipA C-terminal FtsZ-binding domain-containing protein [Massilia sp. CCM 9206]